MQKTLAIHFFLLLALLASPSIVSASEQIFALIDQNHDGWLAEDEIKVEHRRLYQRLLRTSDYDQDGRLSNMEFQAGLKPQQPAKPLVKKLSNELPGANALLLLVAKMDTNSDGQIEKAEVPEAFLEIFDRIEDRLGGEHDGLLDRRELTQSAPKLSHIALRITKQMDLDVEVELALLPEKQWRSVQNMLAPRTPGMMLADPKKARQFFKRLDRDGDGQISRQEAPPQMAERFDRIDRNGNGRLDRKEWARLVKLLSRIRKSEMQSAGKSDTMMLPE